MKNLYIFLIGVLFSGMLSAQTDVYFKIDHQLAGSPFAFSTRATNNLGDDFSLDRLEYYIAEIKLYHDGGQEILVPDTWLLVSADTPVDVLLGNFPVTNLEAVHFSVGVQDAYNHLDPAQYPMTHPLAPKSPSMHWGWAGGYRFVALEGMAGPNLDQVMQIHAVGDRNYFNNSIPTTGTMVGTDLVIDLQADYTKALLDIDVRSGLFNHGDLDEANAMMLNFANEVFSERNTSVSAAGELDAGVSFHLAPNPTSDISRVVVDGPFGRADVRILDLQGRVIATHALPPTGELDLDLPEAGMYFVQLVKEGEALATQKLLVTH